MMPARNLRTPGAPSHILTKQYAPIFTRLAVVKGSLWLASYRHVPPPSWPPSSSLHTRCTEVPLVGTHSQLPDDQICRPCSNSSRHASLKLSSISTLPLLIIASISSGVLFGWL